MSSLCKMSIGFKAYDALMDLICIKDDEALDVSEELIVNRIDTIKLALNNHNETVKQNQNLQQSVRDLQKYDIRELPANDIDLEISENVKAVKYSFYTFLNSYLSIGLIKVIDTRLQNRVSKMYLGLAQGSDFKADVANIVLYGQKIYEEISDAV